MALSLFRFISALGRTQVVASALGTFSLLLVFVLGGFIVAKDDIQPWMIWGYYISPMMYAQNAIAINEFLDDRWSRPNPDTRINEPTVGKVLLRARGMFTSEYMFWVCIVALFGFSLLFTLFFVLALTYLNRKIMNSLICVFRIIYCTSSSILVTVLIQTPALGDSKTVVPTEDEHNQKHPQTETETEMTTSSSKKKGMVLPFKPLSLAFDHVNYYVDMPAEMKAQGIEDDRLQLLEDVSGAFRPGVLTALVGVSGAGKTTLMDVLAGRKTGGYIDGNISISGFLKKQETFARVSGYCEQNDIHSPHVTVYESLVYSAWLRLSPDVTSQTCLMFVEEVMDLVELSPLRNALVGLPGVDGLSTEQRKRLTIGYLFYGRQIMSTNSEFEDEVSSFSSSKDHSIVWNYFEKIPPGQDGIKKASCNGCGKVVAANMVRTDKSLSGTHLLCAVGRYQEACSQPTSGLDARAAAIIMRTVRNTVDTGRTVVCTIHQPSIDIFEAFDELLLMKRGGKVTYTGPLGRHSHLLIEYFESIPGVNKIKDGQNPATWMLDVTSATIEAQLGVDFAEIYANSDMYKFYQDPRLCVLYDRRNQELITELSKPTLSSQDLHFPTKYSRSIWTQCLACLWKQHWSYWRHPQYNVVRLFMTTVVGVLFGVIFWKKGQKTGQQQDVMNLMGAMYAAVMFLGGTNTSAVQTVVSVERTVFYREKAAGMYSAIPYAFAQVTIEVVYVGIQTLIYSLLIYSMIGFHWSAANFFWFYFYIFTCFAYFTLYGMMLVALTPNYEIAAVTMTFFLNFWNLFSGFMIPRTEATATYRESVKKDKRALHIIYQSVNDTIFERIALAKTSKEAWDILHKSYRGETRVKTIKLQSLRCEFDALNMKEGESIEEYFNRTITIVNQLRMNEDNISEQHVVEKILRSLTRNFESVVITIEETKNLGDVSTEELMGILQSHELRLKRYDDAPIEHAFQVQNTIQDRYIQTRNDGAGRGRNKGKGRNWNSIRCYNCQRLGHTAKFCKRKDESEKPDNALIHKDDDIVEHEDTMFMIFNVEEAVKEDCWYLDSGCSNHMTGNRDLFINLDESLKKEVRTGDDKRLDVIGSGEVSVSIKGRTRKIPNVFYVKGLKHNLLSVGQLINKGYAILFQKDRCIIKDAENEVIGKIRMTSNKMFPLHLDSDINLAMTMTTKDTTILWHKRYGHVNVDTLISMENKGLVFGLPKIMKRESLCEGCISGKQTKKTFPRKAIWQASKPLQLVHSDICGPMRTESIGGCRYFITFIDDYTRKSWVYFLKYKSEALSYFKRFKALNEKQSDHLIKTLRSDRGGEYCSNEFQEYLKVNGIRHQLTNSYSPQQNGVAERKNRTLMELSRSMMNAKELPTCYWAEAVACATYILNRTVTKTRPNITPYEAWNGNKPNVEHLKVFGCLAYVHIPKQRRDKLDKKTEKTVFVGYSENSKGYKLYNPQSNKIIISRDVVFDENKRWILDPESDDTHIIVTDDEESQMQTHKDDAQEETVLPEQLQPHASTSQANEELNPGENQNQHSEECSAAEHTQEHDINSSSSDSENEVIRTKSLNNVYRNSRALTEEEVRQKYKDNQVVNFVLYTSADPTSYEEASKDSRWTEAMDKEIESIHKNQTWELVDPPIHQKPIGVKWIYKTKYDEKGNVDKYKARLVVKGYKQKYGIDYQEVFAPVIRFETIRLVLALAAHHGWHLHQMDVKTAFLNGKLEEQVYIEQPQGYIKKRRGEKGMSSQTGFIWFKTSPKSMVHSMRLISEFKESMKKEFEMTDMGCLHYFLGMEVSYENGNIILSQKKYMRSLLEKFRMTSCNTVSTPMEYGLKLSKDDPEDFVDERVYRSLVGSLMYLTNTRPDIMFAVSKISRFMENPKKSHWEAAKRILKYIKGTQQQGITYTKGGKKQLVGFSDSDYAGNVDDSKSTSGYIFHLGSGPVSWQSKKQKVVALSSTEAEYMALSLTGCQALWIKGILNDLEGKQDCSIPIFCDNKSTICLARDPVYHGKSKHIRVKWYYWGSPVAWTVYGLITSQLGQNEGLVEIPGQNSVTVKEFIKDFLGYEYDFLGYVCLAHIGWVVLFGIAFAYGIKFLNFQRR
uniref:Putative zinc finger, CCHC-type n=1 Tax=Helianthus annuus TaxID=4232 RepID=A0A251SKN6_HELAN